MTESQKTSERAKSSRTPMTRALPAPTRGSSHERQGATACQSVGQHVRWPPGDRPVIDAVGSPVAPRAVMLSLTRLPLRIGHLHALDASLTVHRPRQPQCRVPSRCRAALASAGRGRVHHLDHHPVDDMLCRSRRGGRARGRRPCWTAGGGTGRRCRAPGGGRGWRSRRRPVARAVLGLEQDLVAADGELRVVLPGGVPRLRAVGEVLGRRARARAPGRRRRSR